MPPDQPQDERAALRRARDEYHYYRMQGGSLGGTLDAFDAAWQAGRAYERQQASAEVERLRAALDRVTAERNDMLRWGYPRASRD